MYRDIKEYTYILYRLHMYVIYICPGGMYKLIDNAFVISEYNFTLTTPDIVTAPLHFVSNNRKRINSRELISDGLLTLL